MVNVILEVYLYNNFHPEIRTMLVLQLILFAVWIFIIIGSFLTKLLLFIECKSIKFLVLK